MIEDYSTNTMTFSDAKDCYRSGKLYKAASICNDLLVSQPKNFDVLHLLGVTAMHLGNPFRAAVLIARALSTQPKDANANMNLGTALYRQGRLKEAISLYRKAIKIQGDLSEARMLLKSTREEDKLLDKKISLLDQMNQCPSIKFTSEELVRGIPKQTSINQAVNLYNHFGYVLIEDLFSEEYINELHGSFKENYSKYFMDDIFDDSLQVGDKRSMITIKLKGPFNKPDYYGNPLILPILSCLLGKDLILFSLGAVLSLPGAQAQHTHRDLPSLFEDENIDSLLPRFSITLGIPLIEMNEVNGTTRVYGNTHRDNNELSDIDKKKGISPTIQKGSCILFDGRVFHEGTPNNSKNARPLMYNVYSRSWFRDCNNYSKQASMAIEDSEFTKVPENYQYLFSWTRQL